MTIIAFDVAGAREMLPGDGATVTVYGLDAEIAESKPQPLAKAPEPL